MEFRQSLIGDLDQIVRIAEDAKAFLRANGISAMPIRDMLKAGAKGIVLACVGTRGGLAPRVRFMIY